MKINYFALLTAALGAAMSRSLSFRVGNKTVTAADTQGKPTHFTFGAAIAAGEAVLAGQTGSFQVGDISVSIA